MSDNKKDGLFHSFKSSFENFRNTIPWLKKQEPHWGDGTNNEKKDLNDERGKFIYAIFSIYGALGGSIACQYCKYIHQRINCALWGTPFTARSIKLFSALGFLCDTVSFMFVYAFTMMLGAVLWGVLKTVYDKSLKYAELYCSAGLMYGLLFLGISTIIWSAIPFSIFLIGVK